MEKTKAGQKKSQLGFFIGIGFIVVIVIIIIMVGKTGTRDKKADIVSEPTGTAVQDIQPVTAGSFEYKFKNIDWVFDVNGEETVGVPLTDVKVWFKDFTRHNGMIVNFEKPYKLGTYQGDCAIVDRLEDVTESQGRPLGFAQCTYGEEVTEIAIFQNESIISFKKRLQDADAEFTLLYDVDITDIVK
ncbi:MAG: hypothetical protein KBC22_02210 [Candidatus Pacebacteria bacterium]|nr:hypothetical protein [Candidatus Paceibacterota bacterium]